MEVQVSVWQLTTCFISQRHCQDIYRDISRHCQDLIKLAVLYLVPPSPCCIPELLQLDPVSTSIDINSNHIPSISAPCQINFSLHWLPETLTALLVAAGGKRKSHFQIRRFWFPTFAVKVLLSKVWSPIFGFKSATVCRVWSAIHGFLV